MSGPNWTAADEQPIDLIPTEKATGAIQDIPVPHGPVTIAGVDYDHVFGPWMVSSRTSKRRICVILRCRTVDHREVKT